MSQIKKLLVGDDLIAEQAAVLDLHNSAFDRILALADETFAEDEAAREAAAQAFLLRTSRFTRQRRRTEVRTILMRINEWPKNQSPRAARRKSVLGSVSGFMAANPVPYAEGR